ncbi:MAG: hypothetical protein ACKERG_02555 [Candidatus Hodgkinia cicadicola]
MSNWRLPDLGFEYGNSAPFRLHMTNLGSLPQLAREALSSRLKPALSSVCL